MSQSKREFLDLLRREIDHNAGNLLSDNDKFKQFEDYVYRPSIKGRINSFLGLLMPDKYYYRFLLNYRFSEHLEGLNSLYERLHDQASKSLLIQVLAFRILGYKKYALPLRSQEYLENFSAIEKLIKDRSDFIDPQFRGILLFRHQLDSIGFKISLYFSSLGILIDFVIKQYEYHADQCIIKAEEGDIVIDAGACWGDTAVYFAHEAGESGKVFSFEFVSGNLEIFRKNLSLNPDLAKRIEIIPKPVWETSGLKLYHNNMGPGSCVSGEKFPGATEEVETVSIDDLVRDKQLSRVDFIKMDIEGAELASIKGAANTIVKYRPKLAIAIYHSISDFYTIARYIDSLDVKYEFYLKHATIHGGETVLFGRPVL